MKRILFAAALVVGAILVTSPPAGAGDDDVQVQPGLLDE